MNPLTDRGLMNEEMKLAKRSVLRECIFENAYGPAFCKVGLASHIRIGLRSLFSAMNMHPGLVEYTFMRRKAERSARVLTYSDAKAFFVRWQYHLKI